MPDLIVKQGCSWEVQDIDGMEGWKMLLYVDQVTQEVTRFNFNPNNVAMLIKRLQGESITAPVVVAPAQALRDLQHGNGNGQPPFSR